MGNVNKGCTPKSGESRNDFVSRCVKEKVGEGKDQEAAVGMCEGIFTEAKKSEAINKIQSIQKSMVSIIERLCKQK